MIGRPARRHSRKDGWCDAANWLDVATHCRNPERLFSQTAGAKTVTFDTRKNEVIRASDSPTFPIGVRLVGYRFADGSSLLPNGHGRWAVISAG